MAARETANAITFAPLCAAPSRRVGFSGGHAAPIIANMAAAVVTAARRRFGRVHGALALGVVIAGCAMIAGCAARSPAPVYTQPPAPRVPIRSAVGIASWYGPGFNGKRTASGEIYDESDLTAASNIFPLGSSVVVTDLDDGRAVKVRINDRGPYVKGRKIDLSYRAARVLGMVGPGTARVRMDLVRTTAADPAGLGQYFVQVGAFVDPANAERLRSRLGAYYKDVTIDELDTGRTRYYRVRMGGFATRYQARQRAAQSARFGLPTIIVRE